MRVGCPEPRSGRRTRFKRLVVLSKPRRTTADVCSDRQHSSRLCVGFTQRDRRIPGAARVGRARGRTLARRTRRFAARLVDAASVGQADLAQWIAADPSQRSALELAARGAAAVPAQGARRRRAALAAGPPDARTGAGRLRARRRRRHRARRVRPQLQGSLPQARADRGGERPLRRALRIPAARRGPRHRAGPARCRRRITHARAGRARPARGAPRGDVAAGGHRRVAAARRARRRHGRGLVGDRARRRALGVGGGGGLAVRGSFATVLALAEAYPGDPGLVISLLLNRVRLRRGEALYLRPATSTRTSTGSASSSWPRATTCCAGASRRSTST